MKLVTFASPSHFHILDQFFLKSYFQYPEGIQSLDIIQMDQVNPVPKFGTELYWAHSKRQAIATYEYIRDAKENDIVVFADCDVQWFRPLTSIISKNPECDLMAQRDVPDILCGGFMRFRVCPASVQFCKSVIDEMPFPQWGHATDAMNRIVRQGKIKYCLFNLEDVWCVGKVWKTGDDPPLVPGNITVHHASWVLDTKSKSDLMTIVRNQVQHA